MSNLLTPVVTTTAAESEQIHRRGQRIPWEEIWNSAANADTTLDEFVDSLPSCSRQRNDQEPKCTLDHATYDDDEALMTRHTMRRIITRCTSARCSQSGLQCTCRYRILICESSTLATVCIDGQHTMSDPSVQSPTSKRQPWSGEMKAIIDERLSDHVWFTPVDLLGILCKKIKRNILVGQAPLLSQVQSYVKKWRKVHKRKALRSVIALCSTHMYDAAENRHTTDDSMILLCDTKSDDNKLIPDIGTGSKVSPFRIGITCHTLLEMYVAVQQDPRCTTLLHIDNTRSIVKQRYPVFVFGFSDCRCKFFPIIYFCTSQRTGTDVQWCITFAKRVIWEKFLVSFAPAFVMSDADNAQYNACTAGLPDSKFLMCSFHVCQNVRDLTRGKLENVTIDMIFRDLNNLHYSRNEEEYLRRRANVLAAWRAAAVFCVPFQKIADHIIAQWILHPRFSHWQAFCTPPGYAATNNPLEQYHKTLKLVNKDKKATPIEMLERLDQSRLVFLQMQALFKSTPAVSQRLKYFITVRKHELSASPIIGADGLPAQFVQVLHHPRSRYGNAESRTADDFYVEPKKSNLPYKSIHVLRIQWQSMPVDGWFVNAASRTCSCRFRAKFGLCVHIIHATRELGLQCPGMPEPDQAFVTNYGQRGSGNNSAAERQERLGSAVALDAQEPQRFVGDKPMYGPRLPQSTTGNQSQLCGYVSAPHPRLIFAGMQNDTIFNSRIQNGSDLTEFQIYGDVIQNGSDHLQMSMENNSAGFVDDQSTSVYNSPWCYSTPFDRRPMDSTLVTTSAPRGDNVFEGPAEALSEMISRAGEISSSSPVVHELLQPLMFLQSPARTPVGLPSTPNSVVLGNDERNPLEHNTGRRNAPQSRNASARESCSHTKRRRY